nr:HNH endonuclease [Pseudolysinimonas sp.]
MGMPISKINLDHMDPASDGGPDHLLNYGPAHEYCNKARGNRPATPEHRERFRDVWRNYESNGHAQVLSRMIVAAREIELELARFVYVRIDSSEKRQAIDAELAVDSAALRLEFRPCLRGHGFHVEPDDPDFCVKAQDPDHICSMDACRWFSKADECSLGDGSRPDSTYPFTVFFDGLGRAHTMEIARFLEAFVDLD